MSEAIVFVILCKIGQSLATNAAEALRSQLGKEITLLVGVESQIKQIESELTVMNAFLCQAESQRRNDAALQAWLQQVQNLAFEIEDSIDKFTYLASERRERGFRGFLKNTFHKSKNICSWHEVATELKEIQNRLQHLSNMKDRYSIKMSRECNTPSSSGEAIAHPFHATDFNELVGIEEERKRIIQYLTTGRESTSIISVWGMGGSGKTTLVRNVYESKIIKEHFEYRTWISVSHKYEVEDILRRMVKDVFGNKESPVSIDRLCGTELTQTLQRHLHNKSYLIVLDDLWSRDVWFLLSNILRENNNGGRVVITTRLKDVATLAAGDHYLELPKLNESEAHDLFCRWAFRNRKDTRCPEELELWARKIVGKCQGLPLAIVAAGNMLSFKTVIAEEWMKFYNQIISELPDILENKEFKSVERVLNLSYIYLPNHLKSCFLFCGIFPEDYLIPRKRLIRLWVAEGLIAARRTKTLEEVAEEYLNELIDRCLLQVVERNDFGRVKCCRMHDLVRELAILTSAREQFFLTFDESHMTMIDYRTRRLSVNGYGENVQSSMKFPHLRSFYLFDNNYSSSYSISWVLQSARYLRVLDLQDAPIKSLPDDLMHLFNLHYMGLRNTKVRQLPDSLGRLHKLQTLDLFNTEIENLPNQITQFKQLRHLFAQKILDQNFREFHDCSGVEAPNGLWDLRELQTLESIKASMDLVRNLGKLTQLRSLRISNVKSIHCNELFTSIGKMHFLSYLAVIACNKGEYLELKDLYPPPQHLQKLSLKGKLDEGVLESPLFQSLQVNLKWLLLRWCNLEKNPLGAISSMSNLTYLCLQRAYEGNQLIFQPGWFPMLKRLSLADMPSVNLISFEKSMQRLEKLQLVGLRQLKVIPWGLNSLIFLQELVLWDLHPEFTWKIQSADGKYKTKHIPIIDHFYEISEGIWTIDNLAQASEKFQI